MSDRARLYKSILGKGASIKKRISSEPSVSLLVPSLVPVVLSVMASEPATSGQLTPALGNGERAASLEAFASAPSGNEVSVSVATRPALVPGSGDVTSPTSRAAILAASVGPGPAFAGPATVAYADIGSNVRPNASYPLPPTGPHPMAAGLGHNSDFWQNSAGTHVLPFPSASTGGAVPPGPYAYMQGSGYHPSYSGAVNWSGLPQHQYHPSFLSRPPGLEANVVPQPPPLPSSPLPPLPPQSEGHGSPCASVASSQEMGEVAGTPQFPISEAIDRLFALAPQRISDKVSEVAVQSAAEADLGMRPASSSAGPCLTESPMMAEILGGCMEAVRGGDKAPVPGSVPSSPSAWPPGVFVKPKTLPFDHKRFICNAIPSAAATLSQGELSLLNEQDRSGRSVSLKDKNMMELEESSRRGLMAISALDSFLSGLIRTFKAGSEKDPFELKEEIDTDDLLAFMQAVTSCARFAAHSFATLQVNLVLARRDAVLAKSHVLSKDAGLKGSLRALPLRSDALFGPDHVSASIHSLAESRRDMAFAVPRPVPRPAVQGGSHSSKPKHFSQSSSKSQSKKRVFSKTKGGKGKPYDRPQATKAQPKPSPQ